MIDKLAINITSGFIIKDNKQVTVPINKMGPFCHHFCLNNLVEMETALLNNYIGKYSYFKPYFDFVMHELNWVQVGTTLNERLISISSGHNTLLQMPIDNNDHNYIEIPNCSDESLKIINAYYSNYSGFILNNGQFIDIALHHETVSLAILNEILLENPSILNDYNEIKKCHLTAEDYLIQRLGFMKIDNYRTGKLYYVDKLITYKQREILYELINNNISLCELNSIGNTEKAKKLIMHCKK